MTNRTLTDAFGRTVTVSPDGASYSVAGADGFAATVQPLQPGNDAQVLYTINAMAPSGLKAPALPAPTAITKMAFLGRFTGPELIAISASARTNDTINVWLITAQSYDRIDLTDPLTKQGLDALVAAGLITAARETAILTP